MTHAASGQLRAVRAALHQRPAAGAIFRTARVNVVSTLAAALGGIILARVAGPVVRGEYAAVTSWFGVALVVGDMGQPAALCFHVARDARNAPAYVATSRAMMLTTGTVAVVAGLLLAPLLAGGRPAVADAYRIAFAGGSLIAFTAASYTFSLQARDLRRWNAVRLSQPILGLLGIGLLWRLRLLTLDAAIEVWVLSMLLQLGWAYYCCRRTGLVPGRARAGLVRPLAAYGVAQIASLAPATVNAYLDQLVLSQVVPPADLGRYAIAVSMTLLPVPAVSAIGYVAFPRLAAQRVVSARTHRLQRMAVLASAGLAGAILLPLAVAAPWLVPLVFGPGYRGAVPLLWILTPGGVFLACGQVVGDLLRGLNRPAVVACCQTVAAVCTVLLLIALLPLVGVAGAAIASTVAYGVALAAMIRCLWRMPPGGNPHQANGTR